MTIAFQNDGEGAPVLLLNGGLMTIVSWSPIAAPLARRFRVIRCDFRGQLLSAGVPAPTLDTHVGDVIALLDELDLGLVHVAGTSFGGLVAMRLAALRPDLVASLTVITAGAYATPEFTADSRSLEAAARGALEGGSKRLVFDLIHASAFSDAFVEANPGFTEALASRAGTLPLAWFEGLVGLSGALHEFDLRDDLPRIKAPALVIEASDDRVFRAPAAEMIVNLISGARHVRIDGGHALVIERPGEITSAIVDFLASA